MSQKKCSRCGVLHEFSNFTKSLRNSDGMSYRCKDCDRAYTVANREKNLERSRLWYAANKDHRLAVARVWIENNRESHLARQKEYRKQNKDAVTAGIKKWVSQNLDRYRARIAKWAANNPERVREKSKRYRDTHPEAVTADRQMRRARLLQAEGVHTAKDIQILLSLQKYKCVYCSASIKDNYHIDHIEPLSKGGSNWPHNLQATCPKCNLNKHAKDPIKYAQQIGRLL